MSGRPMSRMKTSGQSWLRGARALRGSCATAHRWPRARSSSASDCAASALSSTMVTSSGAGPPAPVASAGSAGRRPACASGSVMREGAAQARSGAVRLDAAAVQRDQALDQRQAQPRPPWARSGVRSAWVNRSNTCGSSSGRCRCRCRARDQALAVATSSDQRDRAAFGVYLAALLSRLATTCTRRVRSPSTQAPRRPAASGPAVAARLDQRARLLDRARHHGLQVDRLRAAARPGRASRARRPAGRRPGRSCGAPGAPMISLAWRTRGVVGGAWRSSWAALLIGASGLRSSCASIARNSSLRRPSALPRAFLVVDVGDGAHPAHDGVAVFAGSPARRGSAPSGTGPSGAAGDARLRRERRSRGCAPMPPAGRAGRPGGRSSAVARQFFFRHGR
jgi:hypothetical protein